MQSMMASQGATASVSGGAGSATPGSATLPGSIDGTDKNEPTDSAIPASPEPLSSEAPPATSQGDLSQEPFSVEVEPDTLPSAELENFAHGGSRLPGPVQ